MILKRQNEVDTGLMKGSHSQNHTQEMEENSDSSKLQIYKFRNKEALDLKVSNPRPAFLQLVLRQNIGEASASRL